MIDQVQPAAAKVPHHLLVAQKKNRVSVRYHMCAKCIIIIVTIVSWSLKVAKFETLHVFFGRSGTIKCPVASTGPEMIERTQTLSLERAVIKVIYVSVDT